MNALFLLLLTATGIPPMPLVTEVSETCPGDGSPRITYEIQSGACAPGGPCSYTTEQGDPTSDLPLTQMGCFWPEAGHWVRDGTCGGKPLWAWRGRTPQGSYSMGPLFVEKSAPKRCPGPPPGSVEHPSTDRAESYGSERTLRASEVLVQPKSEGQVVVSMPASPHLFDDPEARFVSDPMEEEEASRLLAESTVHHHSYGYDVVYYRQTLPKNEVTLVSVPSGSETRCAQVQELEVVVTLSSGLVLKAAGQKHSWRLDSDCPAI